MQLKERRNRRPRREEEFGWWWGRDDEDTRAEFHAIVSAAVAHIAEPVDLAGVFAGFAYRRETDAVLTGVHGALSQHVIYGLAQSMGWGSYLEVGTRYGYSIGAAMAGSERLGRAVTVDPYVDHAETRANLSTLGREDVAVECVSMMSRDFDTAERFDAVYVDGDHSYEAAQADLVQYWEYVKPGGLLLADDTVNNRGDGVVGRKQIGVLWAVQDFLRGAEGVAGAVLKLPTYSGFAVIQKER